MLSKKRILSTCVLLATVMAGAEEGMIVKDGPKNFKTGPVRVDRFEKAIQSLAHEWRPFVKTLSRDLRSYHWATRKELNDISSFPLEGDVALDNEDTAQILKKHIGEFQKFTPKDKAAKLHLGGGLYAAVEPMQSKKWG